MTVLGKDDWHKHVPRDLRGNLLFRRWLLQKCKDDPQIRRAVREVCKRDILFYINTFVFQFNPDDIGHEAEPFITFDFQEHAILGGDVEVDGVPEHRWGILECAEQQEDARWPKSRKMGASWVALMTMDWVGMLHKNKKMSVLSRDEDAVDQSDDPDCLFWKIDFMHRYCPDFLKGSITRKKMRFTYNDTESFIVGEANTSSAFVGGRAFLMLVDEFGRFRNGEVTFDMTSDVSYCRIFVFTHSEQAGMAYDLCFDAKYTHVREIKTHWSQHPERNLGLYRYDEEANQIVILDKTFAYPPDFKFVMEAKPTGGPYPGIRSPWYDKECVRRSERDVAMNLDIDPRGATDKFFDTYRLHVLKAELCTNPIWVGSILYDKETGKPKEFVRDSNGLIKMWIEPKSTTQMPLMRCGAGADVAAGAGTTPSCLSLGNAATGQKFLEYINANIFSNDFATLVVAILRMFKSREGIHPMLCWEVQGSAAFGRRVMDLGYGPVYWRRDEDALGKPRDNKGRPGWNANDKKAVIALMEDYRDGLYDRRCVNPSEFAIDECSKMVYSNAGVEYRGRKKNRKINGDEGSGATIHHGDIVRADALMFKMLKDLGLTQTKSPEEEAADWIDPRTFEGRMKLAELEKESELGWS